MFEITPADIAQLSDRDLRTLVGRLCELEASSRGYPASAVTYGGHQDATDDGLDVRVALPPTASIEGFVPRPATGFQVKARKMPPSKIGTEMCPKPKTVLRPAIEVLANQSGAYIIVSSVDSTSDSSLRRRRDAMAEAVRDLRNRTALMLDFYDSSRIATWVRGHPGLVLWVRERIGKSYPGWQAYGPWAYAAEGPSSEYLLDNGARLQTAREEHPDGLTALRGINQIRALLHKSRTVVRLTGVSGVGKTRLVQALFDVHVGEHSLDTSLAVYTNIADSPDPQPMGLASELLAARATAVLVVDNCSAELHRRLSETCMRAESMLSLITVEYDITEDEPEGTEIFKLHPSSLELIEKLVKRRYPDVSEVDARTIAEFSGGNARVAFALASTVGKYGTIAGLNDSELFHRLFQQRQQHDKSLLLSAQACSLVYSFQADDDSDSGGAELPSLGALVGQGAGEMYRNVSELLRRDLAQRRGPWRAVLPQAIANRLATMALQNIPLPTIGAEIVNGPARLLKSFSRRLGYLHNSKEAKAIVEKWLSPGGMLERVDALNELGRSMFQNVAPAAPQAALTALERILLEQQEEDVLRGCLHYVEVLRHLAYDGDLFDLSVALILKIAKATDVDQQTNEARDAFVSLFTIHFSGTHATIEQRLRVMENLLRSDNPKHHSLGLKALRAALEAWQFISWFSYDFGGHSRDFGYWPRTTQEVKHWFGSTLSLCKSIACSDASCAAEVLVILADKFRGLWTRAAVHEELEGVCRAISEKQFWREGWLAVRQTLNFDSEGFTSETRARLALLEQLLAPKTVVQKVRSIVFSKRLIGINIDDFCEGDPATGLQLTWLIAEELGRVVATDEPAFAELLPDLVSVDISGDGRLWYFGRGLATCGDDPNATWDRLVAQVGGTPEDRRNIQVLRGFLEGLHRREPVLATCLLDTALQDEVLAPLYPALQASVPIEGAGVTRLMSSLSLGKASIRSYRNLELGGVTNLMSAKDFRELVLAIASKPGGIVVGVEILSLRFASQEERRQECPPEFRDIGCELLQRLTFTKDQEVDDYCLSVLIKTCLRGERGGETARTVCQKLRNAESRRRVSGSDYPQAVWAIFSVQARAALDGLCGGNARECAVGVGIIEGVRHLNKNPLDVLAQDDLLAWCDQDPRARYPAMASIVTIVQTGEGTSVRQWTATARRVLDQAPDRVIVLKRYIGQFSPMWWLGSQASTIETYTKLLDDLTAYPDNDIRDFVAKEKIRMAQEIEAARRHDAIIDQGRDERFE